MKDDNISFVLRTMCRDKAESDKELVIVKPSINRYELVCHENARQVIDFHNSCAILVVRIRLLFLDNTDAAWVDLVIKFFIVSKALYKGRANGLFLDAKYLQKMANSASDFCFACIDLSCRVSSYLPRYYCFNSISICSCKWIKHVSLYNGFVPFLNISSAGYVID